MYGYRITQVHKTNKNVLFRPFLSVFIMNPSPTSMFTCTKAISGVAGPRPVLLRPGEAHQATGVKAATAEFFG